LRERQLNRSSTHADEFYFRQSRMRQVTQLITHTEPLEDGPARRVDAIAANFLPWEPFAFEEQRPQTGLRAERRA
jgi:hypothetical protein